MKVAIRDTDATVYANPDVTSFSLYTVKILLLLLTARNEFAHGKNSKLRENWV